MSAHSETAGGTRLESLAGLSTIVADTGEIEQIKRFRPQDCTTNPSLLLKAAQLDAYQGLVNEAVEWGRGRTDTREGDIQAIMDRLAVSFGRELLEIVPGCVSTEVDAARSFDTKASIEKAHQFIRMYEDLGVDTDRVLIKLASTWEGIEAARVLQREGINCNMTLIFSRIQAIACAQAGAFLVSPFVGRITDWYKAHEGRDYEPSEDPGVQSVRAIYDYFKAHDVPTIVMAASFRTTGQILELAGCDRLTIAPKLLEELQSDGGEVTPRLDAASSRAKDVPTLNVDEPSFRWELNADPMATEKLAEGIRGFHQDAMKLRDHIATLL
jgi:transaldolase